MKRILTLALGLGLFAAAPGTATAQNMGWSTITPSITGTDTLGLALREQTQRRAAPAPDRRPRAAVPTQRELVPDSPNAVEPNWAALRYAPSKARRTRNLANFVAKTRQTDPAGAAELEQLFAGRDIIDLIGGDLAKKNMRVDNVADAYTVWWITAWQALHGEDDETSAATNSAVRGQAARALSSTPEFVRASDAMKQEFAEALLVQAAIVGTLVSQNKRDPKILRNIAAAVSQGARGMGLDLSQMTLTENGFVPASASGTTEKSPLADPAVAARQTAESGKPFPYGLVALAVGGAGIGGWLLASRRGSRA